MIVKELISKLSELDSDSEIVILSNNKYYLPDITLTIEPEDYTHTMLKDSIENRKISDNYKKSFLIITSLCELF